MIEQPHAYRHAELAEPDWRRLPGWAEVTTDYRTAVEAHHPLALEHEHPDYEPICALPADGQQWWRERTARPARPMLEIVPASP